MDKTTVDDAKSDESSSEFITSQEMPVFLKSPHRRHSLTMCQMSLGTAHLHRRESGKRNILYHTDDTTFDGMFFSKFLYGWDKPQQSQFPAMFFDQV